MHKAIDHLVSTIVAMRTNEEREKDIKEKKDVIKVSDTVSAAASVYETVRNTLEYDDEHLLRRNAIRRILNRRLGDSDPKKLATMLIRELIWARYLPNNRIETSAVEVVSVILEKYKKMFAALEEDTKHGQEQYQWLVDVLSTEIEYAIGPPCVDEALASYAYQELKQRFEWKTTFIKEEDRDLQLYIAVHRSVLKSNEATLRYRVITLYYPAWRNAKSNDEVVLEVASHLKKVISSVEQQINHPAQDSLFRFVRRHAVVFHLIADIAKDNPEAFYSAVQTNNVAVMDAAIKGAMQERYSKFRSRLNRTVIRTTFFLLLTKSILAILIEYPYEFFVLHTTDYFPLMFNILFPPFLLAIIGVSVRIPKKKNTERVLGEIHSLMGVADDFTLTFRRQQTWGKGALFTIFNALYFIVFSISIFLIVSILHFFKFNVFSILFFLFFLSLVAYFGLRIRNTRRDLLVIDPSGGFIGFLGDVLFLPLVRVGRWIAMRAPKVNIFLFFFDFIIEAPFKAAIDVIENWLGFLKEKREEI